MCCNICIDQSTSNTGFQARSGLHSHTATNSLYDMTSRDLVTPLHSSSFSPSIHQECQQRNTQKPIIRLQRHPLPRQHQQIVIVSVTPVRTSPPVLVSVPHRPNLRFCPHLRIQKLLQRANTLTSHSQKSLPPVPHARHSQSSCMSSSSWCSCSSGGASMGW